uniref:Uncharacterized protein n=1 Tax=Anguilla anguilla TaxID=7936 RepID=A0A0E9PAR3_ANGAN
MDPSHNQSDFQNVNTVS